MVFISRLNWSKSILANVSPHIDFKVFYFRCEQIMNWIFFYRYTHRWSTSGDDFSFMFSLLMQVGVFNSILLLFFFHSNRFTREFSNNWITKCIHSSQYDINNHWSTSKGSNPDAERTYFPCSKSNMMCLISVKCFWWHQLSIHGAPKWIVGLFVITLEKLLDCQ